MLSGLPISLFVGENQQGTSTQNSTQNTSGFKLSGSAGFT